MDRVWVCESVWGRGGVCARVCFKVALLAGKSWASIRIDGGAANADKYTGELQS